MSKKIIIPNDFAGKWRAFTVADAVDELPKKKAYAIAGRRRKESVII